MAEPAAPVCWVCGTPLRVAITRNRNGKTALTLWCGKDGRHLRAFCNDRPTVAEVVTRMEAQAAASAGEQPAADPGPQETSGEPAHARTPKRARPA